MKLNEIAGSEIALKLAPKMFDWKGKGQQSPQKRRLKALEGDDSMGEGLSPEDVQKLLEQAQKVLQKTKGTASFSLEAGSSDMSQEPMDKRVADRMKMRQMLELEEKSGNRELRGSMDDMEHAHPATGRDDDMEMNAREDMRDEEGSDPETGNEEDRLESRMKQHRQMRRR